VVHSNASNLSDQTEYNPGRPPHFIYDAWTDDMETTDRLVQASIKSGAIVTDRKGIKTRHRVEEPDVKSFESAMRKFPGVKLVLYEDGKEPPFTRNPFKEDA
jgi:hypothetical protein